MMVVQLVPHTSHSHFRYFWQLQDVQEWQKGGRGLPCIRNLDVLICVLYPLTEPNRLVHRWPTAGPKWSCTVGTSRLRSHLLPVLPSLPHVHRDPLYFKECGPSRRCCLCCMAHTWPAFSMNVCVCSYNGCTQGSSEMQAGAEVNDLFFMS